jgi:hypothetical protein
VIIPPAPIDSGQREAITGRLSVMYSSHHVELSKYAEFLDAWKKGRLSKLSMVLLLLIALGEQRSGGIGVR